MCYDMTRGKIVGPLMVTEKRGGRSDEICGSEILMSDRPDFPTIDQIEDADPEQLAPWHRFLPNAKINIFKS